MNHPTTEQINAVIHFARYHGRYWKAELSGCWITGHYPSGVDSCYLQQVRNQFGPEWLAKFSLKKALAAQ
jgi:hypothetical protein